MYSKKLIVVLSLLFCFLTGAAQDVIVKRDGSQLSGKVIEITETVVKYKKADNPDGPLYSLSVDDILRINYENGDSDVFIDEEETVPASVLSGKTGRISDTDLYRMYQLKDDPYKVPNKIRMWGFIGGGVMIATGVTLMLVAGNPENYDADDAEPGMFYSGVGLTALGVVAMPTCYFISMHKRNAIKKKLLYSAPLYRQNILEIDGKTLSVGMDFMADMDRTRTLGLGMTFKF